MEPTKRSQMHVDFILTSCNEDCEPSSRCSFLFDLIDCSLVHIADSFVCLVRFMRMNNHVESRLPLSYHQYRTPFLAHTLPGARDLDQTGQLEQHPEDDGLDRLWRATAFLPPSFTTYICAPYLCESSFARSSSMHSSVALHCTSDQD